MAIRSSLAIVILLTTVLFGPALAAIETGP